MLLQFHFCLSYYNWIVGEDRYNSWLGRLERTERRARARPQVILAVGGDSRPFWNMVQGVEWSRTLWEPWFYWLIPPVRKIFLWTKLKSQLVSNILISLWCSPEINHAVYTFVNTKLLFKFAAKRCLFQSFYTIKKLTPSWLQNYCKLLEIKFYEIPLSVSKWTHKKHFCIYTQVLILIWSLNLIQI